MMRKKIIHIFLLFLIATFAVVPFFSAIAQTTGGDSAKVFEGLGKTAQKANLGKVEGGKAVESIDTAVLIGQIAQIFLMFLGVIFLILFVYAGILWMTAAGNDEKISKSKSIMASAAVGLFFVLAASVIVWFVMENLMGAVGG